MKKQASIFAIFLTLGLFPEIAHAQVTVGCPGGSGGIYTSITAAVAALTNPNGPNTITVTGTCNENVSIADFRSLTIVGAGGAKIVQPQDSNTFDIVRSQNITLQNLEIVGVPGLTFGSGGFGVSISEASDVHILKCDVHDNEGGGVLALKGSTLDLHATNIHNNTPGDGLDVVNSSADVRTTTIQNNGCGAGLATCFNFGLGGGVGVFVTRNSIVSLRQNTVIQNNADIGIVARLLSTVGLDFNSPPYTVNTVQGHNITGIFIQEGAHLQVNGTSLVQGNGGGCPHDTPIPCGGIFATENATLEFQGVGTVSGNQGSGIFVEQGTNLHLGGGVTVSNNSGDGVHIQRISIGDFTPIPGASSTPNTITGNGGASVFCDARSLVIGDLTGFSKVNCGQNSPN